MVSQSNLLYIIGDFNFNLKDKVDNTVIQYSNLVSSYNCHIIDKNTITRPISGACLDHVITNNLTHKMNLQYVDYDIFDHRLMFIEIIGHKIQTNKKENSVIYEKINFDNLRNSLIRNPIKINCRDNVI